MNIKPKLIDTNILIDIFSKNEINSLDNESCYISRITYIEFLSWKDFTNEDVSYIKEVINEVLSIIELDDTISDWAATIRRESGIKLGDSIILATSILHNLDLQTNDKGLLKIYNDLKK